MAIRNRRTNHFLPQILCLGSFQHVETQLIDVSKIRVSFVFNPWLNFWSCRRPECKDLDLNPWAHSCAQKTCRTVPHAPSGTNQIAGPSMATPTDEIVGRFPS